ncbi:MAG: MarR family winged helix-turn-helix transcriptional regulator [Thermodesulfobacteriota bacterium]
MSRKAKPDIAQILEIGRTCVCFNVRKAARAVTQIYDNALRPAGLRGTQFTLLAAIKLLQPVTVAHLADATVTDRTTLGRNLKLLEKKGMIRILAGEDLRERNVYLTERGEAAVAKGISLWEKAQTTLTEQLGWEATERLLADLALLVEAARRV